MATWDPRAVREREGLKLTEDQLQEIRKRFWPLAPDQVRADGVFEGGGVLGTAFLGALRCCAEIGLRWGDLAGTSAGAITAALLAADYSIDELDRILGGLDYQQFVAKRTSRLILTGDPSDDLSRDLLKLILFLWTTRQRGEYETEPFHAWIRERLMAKGIDRFADVEARGRRLKVVATDISRGQMLLLPDSLEHPPYSRAVGADGLDPESEAARRAARQFEVAQAVRFSMSIPLFFAPCDLVGDAIVDGGISSNFPLWIFDVAPGLVPPSPTFGFRLVDNKEVGPVIRDSVDIIRALITTLRFAHDRYYLQEKEYGRVINIDLTGIGVTATQFNLTNADKDELYLRGYRSTRRFFLEQWSWAEHLKARGFRVDPDGSVTYREPEVGA